MSGFGLVPYSTAGFDFVSVCFGLFRFVSVCFGLFRLCFDFVSTLFRLCSEERQTDRQTDRQTLMCEVNRPQHLPRVIVSILLSAMYWSEDFVDLLYVYPT